MIFGVYALKDEKVDFKQPFFSANEKEVGVQFERLCNDSACPFPVEDTNLYYLGIFDSDSGKLDSEKQPVLLKKGKECLKKEKKNGKD